MAKEWILNSTMNRFQLNFKRNVGATSEAIRKCSPKTLEEWRHYYYENIRSESQIEDLGRKLYIKITEIIRLEVDNITEQDCIDYMKQLVIDRTFDGYMTEIQTIYGQLQTILNVKVEAAPDEWDRRYNVDFYIKIKDRYIGLQIKPIKTGIQLPEIFKEYSLQKNSHKQFSSIYGGNIFYIFSQNQNGKKIIANTEVIEEIRKEIDRINNIDR